MMQRKSNTEFVHDLMELSDFGGLSQLAIMEAIRFYTELVVNNPRPEDDDEASFVSKQGWWDVNADLHRQIMARAYPEHAKAVEAELKERTTLSSAEKLGASARNLIIMDAWKKQNGK